MSRDVHRLTVVLPTDGEVALPANQIPHIEQTEFHDLACGKCESVIIPNASQLDADSIDANRRRVLVRCSNTKCGAVNQLTDGWGTRPRTVVGQ